MCYVLYSLLILISSDIIESNINMFTSLWRATVVKIFPCELYEVDCALISGIAIIKCVMYDTKLCATSNGGACTYNIDFDQRG